MVNIGFICEGPTEARLISSKKFIKLLASKNLHLVDVLTAGGSCNLLPHNINQNIRSLERDGAEQIIIITDLDTDACITITKQRISARQQDLVIVAVKEIEAWFLASTSTMQKVLKDNTFVLEFPEKEIEPFEKIRSLLLTKTGQGITGGTGGKVRLIGKLLLAGLDITQAASHPNCPSAAYFLTKLNSLTV